MRERERERAEGSAGLIWVGVIFTVLTFISIIFMIIARKRVPFVRP
jgi:hypothetical protein